MSKIIGDKQIIEKARSIPPGDPRSQINWDLIDMLPDMFEAHIVPVKFNLDEDFTNVGTDRDPTYYPSIDFMYRIAIATGIRSYGKSIIEPIYEDVNISEMEMSSTPVIMKKKVGYSVTKQASVLEGDGNYRPGSPRTGIDNAWEYCQKIWTKEEEATEGYTNVTTDKYGNKQYSYTWNNETKYKKIMYDTKWKRRKSFQDRIDKALGMADSKAWGKCIREIMGMPTGYGADQLKSGELYFAKICRSNASLKLEQAAYLQRIANGGTADSTVKLFGPTVSEEIPEDEPMKTVEPEAPAFEVAPEQTKRDELIAVMSHYAREKLIVPESVESVNNVIDWLKGNENAESIELRWNKSLEILRYVESKIPEEGRLTHGL